MLVLLLGPLPAAPVLAAVLAAVPAARAPEAALELLAVLWGLKLFGEKLDKNTMKKSRILF